MEEGYIKINRRLMSWEWYQDANTARVFIHCLIMANWKAGRFRGTEVPRGSFVTSLPSLCEDLNLTTQNVRTAINHLKSTGEITVTIYPHFRIITVNNYEKYQQDNRQDNSQLTGNQQASNRQVTAIEERKKRKKLKEGEEKLPAAPTDKTKQALKAIENLYFKKQGEAAT